MQGQGEVLGQKVTVGSWRASRVTGRRVGAEGVTQKVIVGSQCRRLMGQGAGIKQEHCNLDVRRGSFLLGPGTLMTTN